MPQDVLLFFNQQSNKAACFWKCLLFTTNYFKLGNTTLMKWCCLGYELQELYRAFLLSCYFKYSLLSIRILAGLYLQKMILCIWATRVDISNELQRAADIANPEFRTTMFK